jgi:hypothetical protein
MRYRLLCAGNEVDRPQLILGRLLEKPSEN